MSNPTYTQILASLQSLQNFVYAELPLRNIVFRANVDPTVGEGYAAPVSTFLFNEQTQLRYEKIGASNTAWRLVGSGGGGGGGGDTNFIQGSGVPASEIGNNGEYYLRLDVAEIYFKDSGTWSLVFNGPRVIPWDMTAESVPATLSLYTLITPNIAVLNSPKEFQVTQVAPGEQAIGTVKLGEALPDSGKFYAICRFNYPGSDPDVVSLVGLTISTNLALQITVSGGQLLFLDASSQLIDVADPSFGANDTFMVLIDLDNNQIGVKTANVENLNVFSFDASSYVFFGGILFQTSAVIPDPVTVFISTDINDTTISPPEGYLPSPGNASLPENSKVGDILDVIVGGTFNNVSYSVGEGALIKSLSPASVFKLSNTSSPAFVDEILTFTIGASGDYANINLAFAAAKKFLYTERGGAVLQFKSDHVITNADKLEISGMYPWLSIETENNATIECDISANGSLFTFVDCKLKSLTGSYTFIGEGMSVRPVSVYGAEFLYFGEQGLNGPNLIFSNFNEGVYIDDLKATLTYIEESSDTSSTPISQYSNIFSQYAVIYTNSSSISIGGRDYTSTELILTGVAPKVQQISIDGTINAKIFTGEAPIRIESSSSGWIKPQGFLNVQKYPLSTLPLTLSGGFTPAPIVINNEKANLTIKLTDPTWIVDYPSPLISSNAEHLRVILSGGITQAGPANPSVIVRLTREGSRVDLGSDAQLNFTGMSRLCSFTDSMGNTYPVPINRMDSFGNLVIMNNVADDYTFQHELEDIELSLDHINSIVELRNDTLGTGNIYLPDPSDFAKMKSGDKITLHRMSNNRVWRFRFNGNSVIGHQNAIMPMAGYSVTILYLNGNIYLDGAESEAM